MRRGDGLWVNVYGLRVMRAHNGKWKMETEIEIENYGVLR
jgi:hypothetical protein